MTSSIDIDPNMNDAMHNNNNNNNDNIINEEEKKTESNQSIPMEESKDNQNNNNNNNNNILNDDNHKDVIHNEMGDKMMEVTQNTEGNNELKVDSESKMEENKGEESSESETEAIMREIYDSDEEVIDKEGPKTLNELRKHQLPKIVPITIPQGSTTQRIGEISHSYESTLIVKVDKNSKTMDLESVLCLPDLQFIGKIEDVFGPVSDPFYLIRFNNEEDPKRFTKGQEVHVVTNMSVAVNPSDIWVKGSDASGAHDEEPDEADLDYSDDEVEARETRKLKSKKRSKQRGAQSDRAHNHEVKSQKIPPPSQESQTIAPTPVYQTAPPLLHAQPIFPPSLYPSYPQYPNTVQAPTFYNQMIPGATNMFHQQNSSAGAMAALSAMGYTNVPQNNFPPHN